MTAALRLEGVEFSYGGAPVLEGISLDLPPGALAALIGANGAGKSTLLSLASGVRRPTRGRVELDGRDLARLPTRDRAQRIAVVPQSVAIPFAFTVREFIALGRTPYLGRWRGEGATDQRAITRAMKLTRIEDLAERSMLDLSGGERQRAILALALAQEPDLLLLDEPTANLDLTHQLAFLDLVAELRQATGLTVLAAIHDLNLAALCFERIIALAGGQIIADGTPREVLTPQVIAQIYGILVQVIDHPSQPTPLVVLDPRRGLDRCSGKVDNGERPCEHNHAGGAPAEGR